MIVHTLHVVCVYAVFRSVLRVQCVRVRAVSLTRAINASPSRLTDTITRCAITEIISFENEQE